MSKPILFSFILVLLGVWGCKKETTAPVAPTPKVKTIVTDRFLGYTDTLRYDNSGRLISRVSSDGFEHVFTYTTDKLTDTLFNAVGTALESVMYFLNTDLRADSSRKDYYGTITYTKYTYDAKGHLKSKKELDDAYTVTSIENYVWENGNKKETYRTNGSSQLLKHIVYEYDTEHISTIGNQNIGFDVLGVDSQNPVITEYITTPPSSIQISNNLYTYDASERIATKGYYNNSGTVVDVKTYTYY